MKKKLKRKKNPQAIKRLVELLREVLDAFGWYGIAAATAPPTSVQLAPVEGTESQHTGDNNNEDEDSEDEYGEDEEKYYFDPADVQGAVDEAISTLIKEKVFEEFDDVENAPSLGGIFALIFGDNSQLKEQADYFEELISGYDDQAHVDDLKEAYSILESIVNEIDAG